MITYLAKFVPNLASLTSNLRQLLTKNNVFEGTDLHEKDFIYLKTVLSQSPVLRYYDENLPIVLSVDSSKDGLGAVILKNVVPLAYTSKTMTET